VAFLIEITFLCKSPTGNGGVKCDKICCSNCQNCISRWRSWDRARTGLSSVLMVYLCLTFSICFSMLCRVALPATSHGENKWCCLNKLVGWNETLLLTICTKTNKIFYLQNTNYWCFGYRLLLSSNSKLCARCCHGFDNLWLWRVVP